MNEEFVYSSILDAYQNTEWINLQSGKALLAGVRLDNYFRDPENPSKEEIVLFELETGLMYIDYYLGLRTWSYEE